MGLSTVSMVSAAALAYVSGIPGKALRIASFRRSVRTSARLIGTSSLVSAVLSIGLGSANAATIFYDNQTDWLVAVSAAGLSASYFDTTASNMALANEVGVAPAGGTNMGSTLTFEGSNTGFGFDFEVTAPLGGPFLAPLSYVGTPSNGAFSPGDATGNDNFKIVMSGGDSIFAFALTMVGNASGIDLSTNSENLNFGGTNFPLPLTSGAVPSVFLGAVSDSAMGLVLMDESQTDGDLGVEYSDFRFATVTPVPEPGTGLLLSIGLVSLAAVRRRAVGR